MARLVFLATIGAQGTSRSMSRAFQTRTPSPPAGDSAYGIYGNSSGKGSVGITVRDVKINTTADNAKGVAGRQIFTIQQLGSLR